MGDRRMFTKKVTDDDDFISLSASAQALYLHLTMSADDDGFTKQITSSLFKAHASVSDFEALCNRNFLIQFEDGVIVIRHWRMANAIRKDRHKTTAYVDDLAKLKSENDAPYELKSGNGCQVVANRLPSGCHNQLIKLTKLTNELNNIPAPETDAEVEIISQNDSWFTAFWNEYPKKKDKAQAYKAFSKVCKTEETYNAIMSFLINQIPLWTEYKYIPYPSTWLNGKRWEDDLSKDKQKKHGFTVPFPEVYEEE